MKELDKSTLQLVRYFAEKEKRWVEQYRNMHVVVIWLNGDTKKLAQWAKKHRIAHLPLLVVPANHSRMRAWKINPRVKNTTVMSNGSKPLENFVNLQTDDFKRFEKRFDKHFRNYRR